MNGIDLTGFYESSGDPRHGRYPSLLLQCNQAGETLVGWVVPPPTGIPLCPTKCFAPHDDLSAKWSRREIGIVFIADLSGRGDGFCSLQAAPVRLLTTYAFGDPWYIDVDPTVVLDRIRDSGSLTDGLLRLGDPKGSAADRELRINFSALGAPGFEAIERVSDQPRIPSQVGSSTLLPPPPGQAPFTSQPFQTWVSTHSRPLPLGYLDDRAAALAPDAQPGDDMRTGPLGRAIQEWNATTDDLLRGERRAAVFDLVLSWLQAVPEPKAVYRDSALHALRRVLIANRCKVPGAPPIQSKSYRDWLSRAYSEEYDRWIANGRRAHHRYVPVVSELGFDIGDCLYTFKFSVLGAGLGKLPLLRLGLSAFKVDIKKQHVDLILGSDGKPKINDDGTIAIGPKSQTLWDTTANSSFLIGAIADVGLGFPLPGLNIERVQILTTNDALTKDSFDGARFEVGQLRSPSGSTSIVSAHGPFSMAFSVSKQDARGGFSLSTVVDVPASVDPMTLTAWTDFFKPLLRPAKVFTPSLSLASAGYATGWFFSGARQPSVTPVEPPRRPTPPAAAVVDAELDEFFAVDSHDIPAQSHYLGILSRRNVFEASLAEYRTVFINPGATVDATGWASPEGSAAHNADLSSRRAHALAQAYLDAFEPGTVAPVDSVNGLGEAPALDPPTTTGVPKLDDPETVLGMTSGDPAFPTAYETWKALHLDQVACWPAWRMAQLRVNGLAMLSAGGKQLPR